MRDDKEVVVTVRLSHHYGTFMSQQEIAKLARDIVEVSIIQGKETSVHTSSGVFDLVEVSVDVDEDEE